MTVEDEPKEHFEEALALFLSIPDPEGMRSTYGFMATLLRNNCLPTAGRAYLADRLQAIADGGDPTKILLPRNRKHPALPTLTIMAEVERERAKRGSGDMAGIHERVGKRHGLAASTISKRASYGRTHLRGAVAHMLAAGRDPDVDLVAQALKLPREVVEMLLKPPRRGG